MKTTFTQKALLIGFCSASLQFSFAEEAVEASKQEKKDPNNEALLLGNRDYYPETWMEKGRVYYLGGDYSKAIMAFFKASREHPKNGSVWFNLGMSYYKNKQYDEALLTFLESYRLKKEDKYLYYTCLAYFKAGEIHQSIRYTRQLLGNNPKHGHAWKLLAKSYEHLDQFKEAKSAYQKAHEHLPNDGEVIYALDKMIAQQSSDLSMPKAYEHEITGITTSTETFTGPLPMSRLIDTTAPEFMASEKVGLVPLEESYHINFDAPRAHNFKPSEEKNWTPPAGYTGGSSYGAVPATIESITTEEKTTPVKTSPKPKPVLDDL